MKKRTTLISLICSMVATIVLLVGVLFVMVITDESDLEQRELVITSASAVAIYNGEPLKAGDWILSEGELKEGHTLSVNVTGMQSYVGLSENYISATVLDESGADVTDDYTIQYRPGILNVKERDISIVAESAMKLYDGEPLTADGYTVESSLSLLPNHTLEVVVEGSITEIGTENNRIVSATIFDETDEDVTRNYNVKAVDGKLIVYNEDALVFKSDDDRKFYDGTPLTNDNWSLVSGSLQSDHTVRVSVTGSQTQVGDSENTFSVAILDRQGNEVTDNYEIITVPGTLNVIPAKIKLTSNSNIKVYDGQPLVDIGFTTEPQHYTKSFTFEPIITGSQTEIGRSFNTIEGCTVKDTVGNDVTSSFTFEYVEGVLEVTSVEQAKPELVFLSATDDKYYDGTPLTNENWNIIEGELLEGHTATVTVTGTITDAGITDNLYTVRIKDYTNTDVTNLYNITRRFGTLTVKKLEVTVTSKDAQKVYDGEPLTESRFSVTPENLGNAYTFECQIIGSRTEIGEAPNTIANCYVSDLNGQDISNNFKISKVPGTLTVVENEEQIKTELTYLSGNDSKIYDGEPLTCHICERIEGDLKPGHVEKITEYSSITQAGTIDNEYIVTIYDEFGNDITDQYAITKGFGTLTVTKKMITITSDSNEKRYDGTPLTDDGFNVKNSDETDTTPPIATGDSIELDIIGSITEPGRIINTIANVTITNQNGEDVTGSYEIIRENGRLTVSNGSENIKPTGSVMLKVLSSKDDTVYLKQRSWGDYDPATDSWLAAPEYDQLINGSDSPYYLTSYALRNSGYSQATLKIDSLCGIFVMPYYSDAQFSGFLQQSDVEMIGSTENTYSAVYYTFNNTTSEGTMLPSKYSSYESAYAAFVKENYRYVDGDTLAYMNEIIIDQNFDANDPEIVNKVATYIRKAAEYNLDYDTSIDRAENPVIAFLEKGEGVCRHYAKAATLLYRSLGIPARYTVGFMGNVKAGQTVDITDASGHAWVEVYVNGLGWVKVEVTGGSAEPIKLTVIPVDTRVEYDGNEHTAIQKVSVTAATQANIDISDYIFEAVIEGSRTELGVSATKISNLVIKNNKGKIVYDEANGIGENKFIINRGEGLLQVYLTRLTYTSRSNSSNDKNYKKTYDGYALQGKVSDVRLMEGILPDEYSCVITANASITNVGSIPNSFTVKIYKDGQDVTDHFYVSKTFGTLTVKAREITLTAGSASGRFGQTVTRNEILYDKEDLAATDNIFMYEVEGSQSNIGYSSNVIRDVIIKNKSGNDVTSNYKITYVDGRLTVTP